VYVSRVVAVDSARHPPDAARVACLWVALQKRCAYAALPVPLWHERNAHLLIGSTCETARATVTKQPQPTNRALAAQGRAVATRDTGLNLPAQN